MRELSVMNFLKLTHIIGGVEKVFYQLLLLRVMYICLDLI